MTSELPSVAETFSGKTVLLTGASGFVGKALLEKLLRTCPGIQRVYVILRGRRGMAPEDRLQGILKEPLFEQLRQTSSGAGLLGKVVAVEGDCAQLGLGLSAASRALLQDEVHVVIHAAASVRFDDNLKQAVLLNTRGAREAADLALGMSNLQVLVHVSTTYCNTDRPVVGEQVYPMPAEVPGDWRKVVRLAEALSVKQMERVPRGYHPNTYTFSKALAEQVMQDYSDRLNIAIFRPSIVMGALQEPMPGWTNNLNGPLALCVGITKGLVRTALADKDAVIDMVPLEVVVNGIIVTARHCMLRPSPAGELLVLNGSAMSGKKLTVCQSIDMALKCNARAPHDRVLWHPTVIATSSVAVFTVLTCLLHFLPGLLLDAALLLTGNRTWLLRTYWKIYRATVSLRYFSCTHWVFENAKFYALEQTLRGEDAVTFRLDVSDEDEEDFLDAHLHYVRKYILKESMDPKAAKRNQTIMYVLDRCVRAVLFYIVVRACLRVLSMLISTI